MPDTYTVTDVMNLHPRNTGMEVCGVLHDIAGPGHAPLTAEQYAQAAVRLRAILGDVHATACNGYRFSHMTYLVSVEPWVYACREPGCTWRCDTATAVSNPHPAARHEKGWIRCDGACVEARPGTAGG